MLVLRQLLYIVQRKKKQAAHYDHRVIRERFYAVAIFAGKPDTDYGGLPHRKVLLHKENYPIANHTMVVLDLGEITPTEKQKIKQMKFNQSNIISFYAYGFAYKSQQKK
jgi:hypothetical protein